MARYTSAQGGGLVRAVGGIVVALSAIAQEYGSGINFVMPHSLQSYPGAEGLVPLAMLLAGIALIPEVALFVRYSVVMPRAGSTYVWLTRGMGPYAGFAIAFVWFVGICSAIGFLAYATGTFFGDAARALGAPTPWFTTRTGHLVIGLAAIWSITALHASGIKNYGYLIYAAGALVLIASTIVIVAGFTISPATALQHLAAVTGVQAKPRPSHASLTDMVSVVALFMFAYGGLAAATSLGGEVRDARRNMPRGIIGGWATALVLYTLISYALFQVVPWWAAVETVHAGHAELLTVPALIGIITPRAIAAFLNVLVAIIVLKTIAPQLLDASRFLFGWAEDGFVPMKFTHTNTAHAPIFALALASAIGSLFLIDAVYAGWQIGVVLRAVGIVSVFAGLGLATTLLAWWPGWRTARPFAPDCTRGIFIKVLAVCAILIGLALIVSVVYEPDTPWYFQPWFQLVLALGASVVVAGAAHRRALRNGDDFFARFWRPPAE
jgi:amino acid transporter